MCRGVWLILTIAVVFASSAMAAPQPPQDPLITSAISAAADGNLKDFSTKVANDLRPLVREDSNDLAQIAKLTAFREFGAYFGRIDRKKITLTQVETLKWLPTQPKLLTTLMLAVRNEDSPSDVIQVLDALRQEFGDKLENFPDLTAAMCVVWDNPPSVSNRRPNAKRDEDKIEVDRPKLLMHYYMAARDHFRLDPQQMPFQLAVYVVDNVVSEEEIEWALTRYASRGAIGASYFDVPYDRGAYYGTSTIQAEQRAREYTLPNLTVIGGICADQAYFASQVSRCLGVPAVVAVGRSGTGEAAHAWIGYFHIQGHGAVWDFEEARYPEYRFFKGICIDPQTGEPITESDVSLLAELVDHTQSQRLGSVALTKAADLVEDSARAQTYMRAINLSPGNRVAWLALADLSAKLKLTDVETREFYSVVAKFAAKDYPDFALLVLLKATSGRGTTQQLQLLDSFKSLFDQNRPDIQADLDAARGDLLVRDKRPTDALSTYGEAIHNYGTYGPIAMDLMEKTEKLLRQTNDLNRLADIYQYVWQKLAVPDISAYTVTTPYYIIGQHYEAILNEIGDTDAAANVHMRLDSINSSARSQDSTRPRRVK